MSASRFLPWLAIVLAGTGSGYLLGRTGRDAMAPVEAASTETAPGKAIGAPRSSPLNGNRLDMRHSFAWVKDYLRMPAGRMEAQQIFAGMSHQELSGFLKSAPVPSAKPGWSAQEHLQMTFFRAAATELFHRDGPAAFDWAEETGRQEVEQAVMTAFATEDPVAALERIGSSARHFSPGDFDQAALGGALQRASAQEVLAVEGQWHRGLSATADEFPPGFDFPLFVSQSRYTPPGGLFDAWAMSDPDGVAEYLRGKLASGGDQAVKGLTSAYNSRAASAGEEEAARWACSLMTNATQSEFLRQAAGDDRPVRTEAVMRNLPSDAARLEFGVDLLNRSNTSEDGVIAALRAMNSDDQRAAALSGYLKDRQGSTNASQRAEDLMQRLALPDVQRQTVRASTGR